MLAMTRFFEATIYVCAWVGHRLTSAELAAAGGVWVDITV